jgi:S-adenosylmethionine decarboxylase
MEGGAEFMSALGVQILADMYECDPAVLSDVGAVRAFMVEAALRCGATIVNECFHHFSPHGVSGVVIIAESHLAIHTWPEHGFAALDLFTCGETLKPEICLSYLQGAFRSQRQSTSTVRRGHWPGLRAEDHKR